VLEKNGSHKKEERVHTADVARERGCVYSKTRSWIGPGEFCRGENLSPGAQTKKRGMVRENCVNEKEAQQTTGEGERGDNLNAAD